jgi:putative tryptophan/tyrosine transport system permease protein
MSASSLITDTLITGLPYVPAVMGIYVVFRIRNDFDLTVDGSFVTGGVVAAMLLLHGHGVAVAMIAAVLAAGLAGVVTAAVHIALKVPVILAGLATSIGLFSINLHVLGSTPTVSLTGITTLFSGFDTLSSTASDWATIGVLAAVCVLTLAAIGLFLRTDLGLALRVSGVNPALARSQGVNERALLALSLLLANALAGLSGALVVQQQTFADVNMGVGTLLAGIGAFLVGELFTRPSGSKVLRVLLAVLLGEIVYRFVLVFALQAGLPAGDLKLATALTLIAAFIANRLLSGGLAWRAARSSRVVPTPSSTLAKEA